MTICTHERRRLFGNIDNGEMQLNTIGRMVEKCWNGIPEYFPHVKLDAFIVMPNHVHGILYIIHTVGANNHSPHSINSPPTNDNHVSVKSKGAKDFSPLRSTRHPRGTSKTIGLVIRGVKIGVTKWIRNNDIYSVRENHHSPNSSASPLWQRNYYEHIIRDEHDLNRIRAYIINNPAKWEKDAYYAV
ncbi:MAG: hypothetical protein MRJ65_12580 [Candidatus Brocadiaceae bacterium]|nr:hypothetical protein [Candidatus Brocadiaceae bacterium]